MAGRTITVFLDADTKKAEAGVQSFGASLGKLAKAAGAFVAGSAVVSYLQDTVKAAAEAEQSQLRFADSLNRAGLGASTGALKAYNSELSAMTGYDDDLIADAGAILARFTSDEQALKAAEAAALDYATATGKDVPAAADAIAKASLGNTRALKSLGIQYTATGDQAADLANVVDLVNQKVGGSASADTAARDLRRLETTYGDLQEEIGQVLLPVLADLADAFSTGLAAVKPFADGLEDLSSAAEMVRDAVSGLELPDWLSGGGPDISGFLAQIGGPLASALSTAGRLTRENEERLNALGYTYDEATGQVRALASAQTAAAATTEDLTDAITSQSEQARTLIGALSDMEAAEDDLAAMVRKNEGALNKQGTAFDLNTTKGREQAAAMSDVAEATEKAWQAAVDEGKHAKAQRILEDGRASLEKQAQKWGMTEKAARDYVDYILTKVPPEVVTKAVFDSAAAERAIQAAISRWRSALASISFGGGGSAGPTSRTGASSSTRATTRAIAPVTVNISTGVGDPVAIAREVQKVLTTRQVRLGVT